MNKKAVFFLILFLLLPNLVNAGGSDDDKTEKVTYTTEFEEGYEYGDVKECTTASGIYYFIRTHNVSGKKACLWSDYRSVREFECEDPEMDRYELNKVIGSDGNEYLGYGCRKPIEAGKIEYIEKELVAGYGEQLGAYTGYTCSIIEGNDVVKFNEHNPCYIEGVKAGTATIKVQNDTNKDVKYYKYTVTSPAEVIIDLDNNYNYGNITECLLGQKGFTYGDKIEFDNYTFCGSSLAGYNYEFYKIKCEDGYENFKTTFSVDGVAYKGYGCRKLKDESKREYIKKELYVGYGEQLGAYTGYTCSIIEGNDVVKFNEHNPCYIEGVKAGIARVKVSNNNTSIWEYYEYKILAAPTGIYMLDPNYKYCDVDACKLGMKGYTYGSKVLFDGYKFCGTTLPGYEFEKYEVTCLKKGYDPFQLTFSTGGKTYKGYGCRKLKTTSDADSDPDVIDRDFTFCTEVGILKTFRLIGYAFIILKILIPLLLIIFGAIDMGKAVVAGDEKAIKNAATMLMTRAIAGVIIFFIPTIIDFVAGLIAEWTNRKTEFENCHTCIFNVDECSTLITGLEK